MTPQEAINYITEECDDCPEYKDGECLSNSNCFEVKRLAIKALKREVNLKEDNAYREKKWGKNDKRRL